jgi:signal transduction histidine kinase
VAESSVSLDRRRRLALAINALVICGAVAAALASSRASHWEPLSLVFVLGAFAVACELLSVKVTDSLRDARNPWWFATSAPYVLSVVFLGPAPSLAMAAASLLVVGVRDRTSWRDVVANLGNYGMHIATQAILVTLAVNELHVGIDDPLFPLVVAAIYQYGATASLLYNAGYDALAYGQPFGHTIRSGWRLQVVADPPLALATGLTAFVYATTGTGALTVLVALQLIFIFMAREVVQSQERAVALERHSKQLLALNESRSRLVGQVLAAEESERRRLAEALHDEAMQNLLAARQDLDPTGGADEVARARGGIDATIDQLREAIFELHPAVLEHAGLAAAIEAVAERHARHSGFGVALELDSLERTEHDGLVFMVCRELLGNVAAHAQASEASVALRMGPDRLVLEVRDDGRGFAAGDLPSALERGHIGLASASERIDALGGSFEIDSGVGRGTVVRATIPLASRERVERSAAGSAQSSALIAPLAEAAT